MIGTQIGRYQIESQLGQGGMGIVYKAHDPQLDRAVALKFLTHGKDDAEAKQRFIQEARAASALDHPNICTIYDIGENENGQTYIAMAYYEGQTLKDKIKQGPLEETEAIGIATQIAEGLREAHTLGIVHRDIKPANIFLTAAGRVKILDFGLAKIRDVDITQSGSTMGTAAYMSPEQARGDAVDQRTDIWSLGVILYEMLAGQRPFRGSMWEALLYAILHEEPAPIETCCPNISPPLAAVVSKTLLKDRVNRFDTMGDLLEVISPQKALLSVQPGRRMQDRHAVGRSNELKALMDGLQNVHAGAGHLIGISGEAGIGKTTVVETFLDEIQTSGKPFYVAKGQCSERLAGTEAYLPIFDAIERLLLSNVSLEQLMREKAPWWYVQVTSPSAENAANQQLLDSVRSTTQEQLKRELVSFLAEASQSRPLMLVIEDLHWADVSTVDMLAYLGARFETMRVLFLATYRPVEMQLSEHPFLQIKPDLISRGLCKEIALHFLSTEDVSNYLLLEYPNHQFPNELAEHIHARTEGSPLFMADLIRDLQQRDIIMQEEETWKLMKSIEEIELELPDSVKAMIERKIGQLNDEDRRLMITASVQGFEFDSAVLAVVLEKDEEEIEDRLDVLEKNQRFVEIIGEDEFPDRTLTLKYRFVHVLYQNSLYESLTRTKRARTSKLIARTIEKHYTDNSAEIAAELASLFEIARDYVKAAEYYSEAATHSAQVFAYNEAIQLGRQGLRVLAKIPESHDRDLIELHLQAGLGSSIVATLGYGADGVGQSFARAQELSDKLGSEDTILSIANGLVLYYNVTLQLRNTLKLTKSILEDHSEDNHAVFALVGKGIAEQFLGNLGTAEADFFKAGSLKPFVKSDSNVLSAWADLVYGYDHLALNNWLKGFPDKAIVPNEEAKVLAMETHNPFNEVHYYAFGAMLYQYRGDLEKVIEMCDTEIRISEENGFSFNIIWATVQKGWAVAQQGDLALGISMMSDNLQIWEAVGMKVFLPYYKALLSELYLLSNAPETGLSVLAEAFEIVQQTDHLMWSAELFRIKGSLLHKNEGDSVEVESCFKKAMRIAVEQQAKSLELRAAMDLGRLWHSQGKTIEARELLGGVYDWFTEGFDTKDLKDAKALLTKWA